MGLGIYFVCFGLCGALMLGAQYGQIGRKVAWILFFIIFSVGAYLTWADDKQRETGKQAERQDALGREQERIGGILVEGYRNNQTIIDFFSKQDFRNRQYQKDAETRRKSFIATLSKFISVARRNIKVTIDYFEPNFKERFQKEALQWSDDVEKFLHAHCYDKTIIDQFLHPVNEQDRKFYVYQPGIGRILEKYGGVGHPDVIGFYDRRIGFLQEIQSSPIGCDS